MRIKRLRKKLKKAQKKYGNVEVMLPQVVYTGNPQREQHYKAHILYAEMGVNVDKYVFTIY